MGIFTDKFNEFTAAFDEQYQQFAPKPTGEYAKASLWGTMKVATGIGKKAISALWTGTKSLVSSAPAGLKAAGYLVKGWAYLGKAVVWDLPRDAYKKYKQNQPEAAEQPEADAANQPEAAEQPQAPEAAEQQPKAAEQPQTDTAWQQAGEDFSYAGAQFAEAAYTFGSTAYNAESLFDTSILADSAEAFSNGVRVPIIGIVEGAKVVGKAVANSPIGGVVSMGDTLASRAGTLAAEFAAAQAELAKQKAEDVCDTLYSFLPSFEAASEAARQATQGAKTTLHKAAAAALAATAAS
jgi:hypothetical protein